MLRIVMVMLAASLCTVGLAQTSPAVAEAERAKAEAERAKAEADRSKAEAARAMAEAEKVKADAEKVKAAAVLAKTQADKARLDATKAKAEAVEKTARAKKDALERKKLVEDTLADERARVEREAKDAIILNSIAANNELKARVATANSELKSLATALRQLAETVEGSGDGFNRADYEQLLADLRKGALAERIQKTTLFFRVEAAELNLPPLSKQVLCAEQKMAIVKLYKSYACLLDGVIKSNDDLFRDLR